MEDDGWHRASAAYSDFLRRHEGLHVLFLELGVGANTPIIVKIPFIRMTAEWKDATYACLNLGEAFAPEELKDKAIVINGDIGDVLEQLE